MGTKMCCRNLLWHPEKLGLSLYRASSESRGYLPGISLCNGLSEDIPVGDVWEALTVKFLTKRFITEYDPNLEDIYSSEEVVDQQPVTLRVMDTCEQEGPVNSERYLSWANVFLVVYSIDNMESFNGCQLYLQTLASHNKTFRPQTPIILLGNKKDMDRYRLTGPSVGW
ncbi:ras-like protein family member 12 isoform X6 [Oreochromis niloticus]|uniref:ras-like protein family member 12 isoform X6 n=1 Tax=Oreochromis niloticus TaxID=8128 RepID=UPI0003944D63|nr:ras-like protein family member 12 isoform X6 [Oreochromis niloticus]